MHKPPRAHGIRLKKEFGQHFLRDERCLTPMLAQVQLQPNSSVLEIGGGSGILTRAILRKPLARLWVFEIDQEWADHLRTTIPDQRLTVFHENILDVNLNRLADHAPWTLLANLPYQITFPLLYRIQRYRHLFAEGVIMIQEEVAQKIVKTHGRDYGYPSLLLQWFFDWQLLDKIPPSAFNPPPKVHSRLVYFKSKVTVPPIAQEEQFWKFIKACFHQPRRTLKNNLAELYDIADIPKTVLALRAQQMRMPDFLQLWEVVRGKNPIQQKDA